MLRTKAGELEAAGREDWGRENGPTAVVELLDSLSAEGGRVLPMLVKAGTLMVERGRPPWVDARLLGAGNSVARHPGGPLVLLDELIEAELGLLAPDVPCLVPVLSDSPSERDLRGVALLRGRRDREVAVRVRGLDRPPGHIRDRVRRVVAAVGGAVHVVLDVGFVDAARPVRAERVVDLVSALEVGQVSTTLLAGSIPAKRTDYATSVRDRAEVELWERVSAEVDVRYGDYGVVHPNPPAVGASHGRNPFPFLHYTVERRTVSLRRKPRSDTAGAAAEAFGELAEELLARQDFAGAEFSWGDRELRECGQGRAAGAVPRWVAMATSHHLAHVAGGRL
ncbi:hypothetical protein GCM10010483_27450 [Actinokineospora diospyrosa]